jgi:hypothetical protein
MFVCSAAGASKRVFTLNFDNLAYQNGVYTDVSDSVSYVSDAPGLGKSAQFDGASDIEVPYFQNNEFRQFTIALKFKQQAGGSTVQGLVSNGGNPAAETFSPPSIYLLIDNGQLVAGIITEVDSFQVSTGPVITILTTFLKYSPSISVVTLCALVVCAFQIALLV